MPHLSPAEHLWQVGLAVSGLRVCDTLVLPVGVDLTPVQEPLRDRWPTLAWVPPVGYPHLTLAAVENVSEFTLQGNVSAVHWQAERLEATGYSLRLRVSANLGPLAAAFQVPTRPAYLTLAYAVQGEDLGDLCDVPAIAGVASVVEHRRFTSECAPFSPDVVASWTLGT